MRKIFVLTSVLGFAAAQFLQIAWISKAYGADVLGAYGLIVGVTGPLLAFLSVSQRYSILVEENFGDKIQSVARAGILLGGLLLYVVVQLFFKSWAPAMLVMVLLVGLNKILEANFELKVWEFQRDDRWREFAFGSICRIFPAFISIGLGWVLDLALNSYLLTLLSMSILCQINLSLRGGRNKKSESISFSRLLALIISLVPIGFSAGLESWAVIWPRFFIEGNSGLQDVGRFLLFTQISAIFGLVASASLQSDMPRIKKLHIENDRSGVFKKAMYSSLLLGGVMAVGALIWWFTPSAWIGRTLGSWVEFKPGEILLLPLISWLWYCGGYFSNVLAICRGKNWLPYMSACIAITLCAVLYGVEIADFSAYEKSILALSVAFGFRFSLSATFLFRYLKNG